MPNRPEYMAIWLGITRVGGVVSLINTQLRGAVARALHRHRRAEAHHRRRGLRRAVPTLPRNFRAGRKSGRMAPAGAMPRIDREIERFSRGAADGRRAPRT